MGFDLPENPYRAPDWDQSPPGSAEGIPPTPGGKLGRAFGLLSADLPLLAAVTLTVQLPVNVVIQYATYDGAEPDFRNALRLAGLLGALFGPISTAAVVAVIAGRLAGQPTDYSAALAVGLRCWGRLFVARFVAGILILLGMLLLVIPGLVLAVRYALIDPVVVLEGLGATDARQRSRELVRGKGWEILFAGAFGFLIVGVLNALIGVVFEVVEPLQTFWGYVASDCVSDVLGLYLNALLMLYYWEAATFRPLSAGLEAGPKAPPPFEEL